MKINELIKTQEVAIPNTDIVVKIREDFGWQEYLELLKIEDDTERGIEKLAKQIVSWNIQDDVGAPLPVTKEAIAKLPRFVIQPVVQLSNEIWKKQTEKKTPSQGSS